MGRSERFPGRTESSTAIPRVGMVSLGCPKALVDSERILTQLRSDGYDIAPSYDDADLVVVNTCGFIDAAQAESLDAIAEAVAENGRVIVTGCLGAHADEIQKRFPQVLAVTGPHQYEQVVSAVRRHAPPPPHHPFTALTPPQGIKLTPRHYAYLKISEGCNNRCSFCIIPSLRGKLVSRPVEQVLAEANQLARSGVQELLVISQDTSAYGVDIKYQAGTWRGKRYRSSLGDLCRALGELGVWVRLHYIYPYPHVDAVIPLMAEGQILPYLDVPFQHASPRILKLMRRPAAVEDNLARVQSWRAACPELTLRSTFIVGFPGETEDDFEQLLEFLELAQLDRVGCFQYSPVAGAAANALPDPVPDAVKQDRYERLMTLQAQISATRLRNKVGRSIEVLVDQAGAEGAVGRSHADAPEIDGLVYLDGCAKLQPGQRITARVTAASDYDLYATPV